MPRDSSSLPSRRSGQTANAAAVGWLTGQQCQNGGWTLPDQAVGGGCIGDPTNFEGPDNQTTSIAVQGLIAQGALTAGITAERALLHHLRSGRRRRVEHLPEHRCPAPADRLPVHRAGHPGTFGPGPVPDELHVHDLGALAGRRPVVLCRDLRQRRRRAGLPGRQLGEHPRHQSRRSDPGWPDLRVRADQFLLGGHGYRRRPSVRFGHNLRIACQHPPEQADRRHGGRR